MMSRLSPRHALALAAALTTASAAQAAAPTEAQLRSITLYGNTTIADDSVGRWGFWEQFEPPAAGNTPSVSVAASPATWYRPLASATPPSVMPTTPVTPGTPPTLALPCESGGLCGFGVFTRLESSGQTAEPSPVERAGSVTREHAAAVDLPSTPISLHPYAFSATVTQQTNEGIAPFPAALSLNPVALGDQAVPGALTGTVTIGKPLYSYYGSGISTNIESQRKDLLLDAEVAWYIGNVNADGESRAIHGISGVAGRLTSAADMDALNKGNVQAFYSGRLYSERYADVNDNIQLSVNFGQGTFTGSVNGGQDSSRALRLARLPNGQTLLQQGVGFNIDGGTIKGSTFQSTRLSATDGTVTGLVVGGFFGPEAAAAAGVIDITKTRTNEGPYTSGRLVMPFLTQRLNLKKEQ